MSKLFLLLLFCIVLFNGKGQPGSLDSSFGTNGVQTTPFLSNVSLLSEEGRVVLTGTNGNIFVVVPTEEGSTRIAKYLPDGTLDISYGNAGYSNAVKIRVNSATLQKDKLLVAGGTYPADNNQDFALVRYTADGTLDSSFGVNGLVTTDFDKSEDEANAIALQGDKILVAGHAYNTHSIKGNDFAVARYTADGTLDVSFGVNGKTTTDFYNSYDFATSIAIQENKIIVAGYSLNNNWSAVLTRYTVDGALDSSFGENGKVRTDINDLFDYSSSIAIQGNKIVMVGYSTVGFALTRYMANGAQDSSFGVNGKAAIKFRANAMVLQGDKIIASGYTYVNDNDFSLARYTADGALDSSFGVNGLVTTDFHNSNDNSYSIALQGDKIVVSGSTDNAVHNNDDFNNVDFALDRYTADGVLDPSFRKNGLLAGYFPTSQAIFTGVALQEDKIITAGYATGDSSNTDFALARYTASGVLDLSFGVHGKLTTDFNNSDDRATSVALQGGKIIVGGYTGHYSFSTGFTSDFALARYTADGKLDSTFGVNGKATTDFNNSYHSVDEVTSIALKGEKIVAGGFSDGNFSLARYTVDGQLDSSFGVNGKVTTDFTNSFDRATAIALQGDKIIAGGFTLDVFNKPSYAIALVRYNADGTLDSSFGVKGKTTTFIPADDDFYTTSIALQADKIVVGGRSFNADNGFGFVLARFNTNGTLDSSFGVNAFVRTDFRRHNDDYATSIALQGNKIILAGYTGNYDFSDDFASDFALARYTADGTLDSSFGKNGKVMTDVEYGDVLQAIIVHQNKLYAVGGTGNPDFTTDNFFGRGTVYGAVAAYQLEAPEPSISIADVTVSESKKLAVVTVRLSKPTTKLIRVHFTSRNKTAVYNQDYLPIRGPLFFIPGVNNVAKIFIPIIDNNKTEGEKQFEIVLSDAHNATIQDNVAVVTILDDDACPITKQSSSLHINVSPNPSADAFTVQLQGSSDLKHPASIRVYDVSGRLIEQRENISIGQSIHLGEQYRAGIYIIEAVQNSRKLQTRVIKTGK